MVVVESLFFFFLANPLVRVATYDVELNSRIPPEAMGGGGAFSVTVARI